MVAQCGNKGTVRGGRPLEPKNGQGYAAVEGAGFRGWSAQHDEVRQWNLEVVSTQQ